MPKDPRTVQGVCESLGVSGPVFDGTFEPWQTGGAGAGTIAASVATQFPWPPVSIANAGAPATLLPIYTPTGSVVSLPPPTPSPSATKSVDLGNGWFNPRDTAGAPTPIAGCSYPDGWNAVGAEVPESCGGSIARRAAEPATATIASVITPASRR